MEGREVSGPGRYPMRRVEDAGDDREQRPVVAREVDERRQRQTRAQVLKPDPGLQRLEFRGAERCGSQENVLGVLPQADEVYVDGTGSIIMLERPYRRHPIPETGAP